MTSVKRFLSLQFRNPKTDGRTPWPEDQAIARPLPIQDNTNTEYTQRDIHTLSGIRTHEPSFRAGEDSYALDRAATVVGRRYIGFTKQNT
jgi:hypothetical protein